MVRFLWQKDSNFWTDLAKLHESESSYLHDVDKNVDKIIADIKEFGDKSLVDYTLKFDGHDNILVTKAEIDEAIKQCDKQVYAALIAAKERIFAYHQKQLPQDFDYVDNIGVRLGNLWRAIDKVGVYVPGGLASYPSSVLMNAIPAIVAGVKSISMVVPAPKNQISPYVLAAANILGIEKIYKIGGAQAVAALAYGTETIHKVDKIVGPGNIYVATAKRKLFGQVGIDMIAGPSEIMVVADKNNNPEWVAADLLSQAEHDKDASAILVTDNKEFADKVIKQIDLFLAKFTRKDITKASWDNNGLVIILDNLSAVNKVINLFAPEHLELCLDDDFIANLLPQINNAGAIFLGKYTPEAIGDYIAGPSHVLPTSGTARFSSGLSVYDFLKRISLIGCKPESFASLAKNTEILATAEHLEAHALSISIRD